VTAISRWSLLRFVLGLVVLGALLLVGIVARGGPSSSTPTVGWTLASAPGGPAFQPEGGPNTTVILISTNWWTGCSPWGDLGKTTNDDSWLTPEITYTPWTVAITLHESASFRASKCGSVPGPGLGYDIWSPLEIHLGEPLGGRTLFDGSLFPPAARPYR
jgi:hypothetical protein